MADIKLKNALGNEQTYTGINKLTVPNAVSGTTEFIDSSLIPTSIYKFYQQDGTTEITNITVAGLENAYYYTKNGGAQQRVGGRIFHINADIAEGSGDKFYVYDTTNGLQSPLMWSTNTATSMDCTTNTIGSGKTNSAIMNTAMGDISDTIWYFIKNTMNAGNIGGCNDWYIGSQLENDHLRSANLVDWFSSNFIWSSVESSYNPVVSAMYWSFLYGYCVVGSKTSTNNKFFAIRSF